MNVLTMLRIKNRLLGTVIPNRIARRAACILLTCIPRGLPRFLIGKFENLGFHI